MASLRIHLVAANLISVPAVAVPAAAVAFAFRPAVFVAFVNLEETTHYFQPKFAVAVAAEGGERLGGSEVRAIAVPKDGSTVNLQQQIDGFVLGTEDKQAGLERSGCGSALDVALTVRLSRWAQLLAGAADLR